ncbi:6206_t:CDS:2 [Entrophospora sp. SA101]|nr:6206_t:CDS:2 [Entrophospora sp. SA101]
MNIYGCATPGISSSAHSTDFIEIRYEGKRVSSSGDFTKNSRARIQVIGERIFVSVLDLFEGAFYRVYRISEITIPLRISSRQVIEDFLRSTRSESTN